MVSSNSELYKKWDNQILQEFGSELGDDVSGML
jgi:hypothetical protein